VFVYTCMHPCTDMHACKQTQVLNKIDLPGADPDRTLQEIEEVIGLDCTHAVACSAKSRINIEKILETVSCYIL
jgi:translation elongation factor EF-4